jgi:glyoxylase-like metal-dependent hydrolase (beta-lactamase superfamily II)
MEIHRLPMGPLTNGFLLRTDQGTLLIDAGFPNRERRFTSQLNGLGIPPGDIRLILVTHGHADHVGSLQTLKKQTGAPVAIHQADSHLVRHGIVAIPPGATPWGRLLSILFRTFSFLGRFDPVEPELIIEGELSVEPFGIPGKIIPTPGHTPGSVSLVLESGEAFIGDLAVNAFPMGLGLGIPAVAENVHDVYLSWQKLLSSGSTIIYPAHGRPFEADRLRKKLSRTMGLEFPQFFSS